MNVLVRSRYEAAESAAQGGPDPITSGLLRMAIRSRPFLSELFNASGFRYYKGGQSA